MGETSRGVITDNGMANDHATVEKNLTAARAAVKQAERDGLTAFVAGRSSLTFEEAMRLYGWDRNTEVNPWLRYPLSARQELIRNVLEAEAANLQAQREAGLTARAVAVIDAPPVGTWSSASYAFLLIPEIDWYKTLHHEWPGVVSHVEIITHNDEWHEGVAVVEYFDFMSADQEIETIYAEDFEAEAAGAETDAGAALARLDGTLEAVQNILAGMSLSARLINEMTLSMEQAEWEAAQGVLNLLGKTKADTIH